MTMNRNLYEYFQELEALCVIIWAQKKGLAAIIKPKTLLFMVRLAGIEPAAHGLGIRCSIP